MTEQPAVTLKSTNLVICNLSVFGSLAVSPKQNLQQSSRSVIQNPLLNEASLLALPVVVSLINLLLPGLFNLAAWMEDYESPSVRTYVAIGR